jgi:hypothetical protein
MKSNLMLKKFNTNAVPGTMNQKELRTFFGGKMLYCEDIISIDDDSIEFSQVVSDYNNGYQYFDIHTIPEDWETKFSENLIDLKSNNQTISLLSQNTDTMQNNTNWQIKINGSSILMDYLFFRIKQQRVFKMINANETISNNINAAIYDYIKNNIFSRYRLTKMDFYVQYYDIQKQNIYSNIKIQYNPQFNIEVYKSENLTNMSIIGFDPYKFDTITAQYNQSKSSKQYSFDYYFNLTFAKNISSTIVTPYVAVSANTSTLASAL